LDVETSGPPGNVTEGARKQDIIDIQRDAGQGGGYHCSFGYLQGVEIIKNHCAAEQKSDGVNPHAELSEKQVVLNSGWSVKRSHEHSPREQHQRGECPPHKRFSEEASSGLKIERQDQSADSICREIHWIARMLNSPRSGPAFRKKRNQGGKLQAYEQKSGHNPNDLGKK
jgi:hypothetical protein